jgi:hypothetical protein
MAWLHRAVLRTPIANDFDAAAGFIGLCEQDLNERLRARCMVARVMTTIVSQYSTLPDDYLEMFDLRLANGGPPLTYVTREMTANAYWQANNSSLNAQASVWMLPPDFYPIMNPPAYPWNEGCPAHFSVVGNEIEWSPFPAPADPDGYAWPVAEMAYYQRLNLGTDDTSTNNVLSTYPAAYIYGSLIHAAPFIRDDGRLTVWKGLYDTAIGGANAEHERARTQGSPLRARYRRLA